MSEQATGTPPNGVTPPKPRDVAAELDACAEVGSLREPVNLLTLCHLQEMPVLGTSVDMHVSVNTLCILVGMHVMSMRHLVSNSVALLSLP